MTKRLPSWERLADGDECPFDAPRPDTSAFHYLVRKLSVSSLYLKRDQSYLGACTLIYDVRHVIRLDQLAREEWLAFADDLRDAESAIYRALRPDHVNVESLGNVIPHLHWHIIPRYKDDESWGGPIWTTRREEMLEVRLEHAAYADLAQDINTALDSESEGEG